MNRSWLSWYWQLHLACSLAIVSVVGRVGSSAIAQIVPIPDATLGAESSIVRSNGPGVFQINGGATRGKNLFHSFSQFSVPTNGIAAFNNAVRIQNIISRVTGGSVSNIDGLIQANGLANLFLINPNGIVFGPHARLNIGGSFVGSTANSLKFADGTEFSATADHTTPLLTISVPIGLQFGPTAGEIRVQGPGAVRDPDSGGLLNQEAGLKVSPDAALILAGSGISLEGGILATDGGRIELGSVSGTGLVSLTPIDKGFSLSYGSIPTFAEIKLSGAAAVDASGEGGGNVQVRGSQVTLKDGSQIAANTLGSKPGGTLNVNASDSVEVIGTTTDGLPSALFTFVYPRATGTGGNIAVETEQLTVRDGAVVSASTFNNSTGPGGNLTINTGNTGQLVVQNGAVVAASAFGTGPGGNLTINTGQLIVQNGATVNAGTFGAGQAGNLTVKASDSVELDQRQTDSFTGLLATAQPGSTGGGGNLTIDTSRLTAKNGAGVQAATFSLGPAGNLNINASDSIELSGATSTATLLNGSSGLFVSAQSGVSGDTIGPAGNVGNLNVTTGRLTVENGAKVSADNFGTGQGGTLTLNVGQLSVQNGGLVRAGSFGNGPGGTLTVKASNSVDVIGTGTLGLDKVKSTLFTQAQASGDAGDLNITTGSLNVRDGGTVTASSTGSGKAGNLQLTAGSIGLDNGSLTSTTFSGDGGNIILQGQNLLLLRNGGQISTTAGTANAGGNGGKITITTPFVIAVPQENSKISANAFKGNGGTVTINASGIFGFQQPAPNQSQITASSTGGGLNGVVTLNTPEIDPSRGLVALPVIFADVSRQIAQGCGTGNRTTSGRFIVTGRGGLPPNPSDTLSSDAILDDTHLPTTTVRKKRSATVATTPPSAPETVPIVPATGVMFNGNDEVTLIAAAPTATLQIPWLSPTACRAYAS